MVNWNQGCLIKKNLYPCLEVNLNMFAKHVSKNFKKSLLIMEYNDIFFNLFKIFRETEDYLLIGRKNMRIKTLVFFIDLNFEIYNLFISERFLLKLSEHIDFTKCLLKHFIKDKISLPFTTYFPEKKKLPSNQKHRYYNCR